MMVEPGRSYKFIGKFRFFLFFLSSAASIQGWTILGAKWQIGRHWLTDLGKPRDVIAWLLFFSLMLLYILLVKRFIVIVADEFEWQ